MRRTLAHVLPVVWYFLARLVLFVLATVLLEVVGAGPVLALLGGLLISILLSYLLLRRLREPATTAVAQRMQARQERRAAHPDEDELFEDAAVDAGLDTEAAERAEIPDGRPDRP